MAVVFSESPAALEVRVEEGAMGSSAVRVCIPLFEEVQRSGCHDKSSSRP